MLDHRPDHSDHQSTNLGSVTRSSPGRYLYLLTLIRCLSILLPLFAPAMSSLHLVPDSLSYHPSLRANSKEMTHSLTKHFDLANGTLNLTLLLYISE